MRSRDDGLVDEVDRLVGQEAVGDVAVRERRRGDDRRVGDAHLVVDLVALLEAAEDRDRVLDRRLLDHHRLEAPLERRVLLDVLAVLVERGGADRAQLAAREHRLQQVRGVDRALRRAGADDRVQLVDEEDDLARGLLDLVEDGLEPVLELAAVLRAGDERADVERDDLAVAQRLGDVAVDRSRWARPSAIAVLPTPGSPMRTGLFFVRRLSTWTTRRISSSRPMTGSSSPRAARSVRSMPNFSSAWILSSGFWSVTRPELPRTSPSACWSCSLRRAGRAQRVAGLRAVAGEREQHVLGGDELVLELAHLVLGAAEHLDELGGRLAAGLAALGHAWAGPRAPRSATCGPARRGRRACRARTGRSRPPARAAPRAGARASPAGCARASARRLASRMASWVLMVKRSGCMKSQS